MTGWGAVVLACAVLAVCCLVWLIITIAYLARRWYRNTVWRNAMRLAVVAPELVAQVAAEAEQAEDPEPAIAAAAGHVVSIDALPHDTLVETVLTAEAREAELIEQVQNTQTDAITLVAQALGVAEAQQAETDRQTRAKRRHWSTVKRLKGNP